MWSLKLELMAGLCRGCLSSDRRLAPLDAYAAPLYAALLRVTSPPFGAIRVCWECRTVLQKTLKFQMRASRAREWLEWARWQQGAETILKEVQTLSTLQGNLNVSHLDIEPHNIDPIGNTNNFTTEFNIFDDYTEQYDSDHEFVTNIHSQHKSNNSEESQNMNRFEDVADLTKLESKYLIALSTPIGINEKTKELQTDETTVKKEELNTENVGEIEPSKDILTDSTRKKRRDMSMMIQKLTISDEELLAVRREQKADSFYVRARFKCESCIIGYICEEFFVKHKSKYHSDRAKNVCRVCERRYHERPELIAHLKTHYVCYKCKSCDMRSPVWQYISRHYLADHLPKQRKRKKNMKPGHMAQCVTITEKELKKYRNEDSRAFWYTKAKYKCETCLKGFRAQLQFNRHYVSRHTEEGGALICDICLTHKATRKSLIKHIQGHYTVYKCKICGKLFTQQLYMYRHYRKLHVEGKSYPCKYCSEIFIKRMERKLHYETVHKSFPCEKCDQKFKLYSMLQKHILNSCSKRQEPSLCIDCGQTFSNRDTFRAHYKRKHEVASPSDAYCVECDKQYACRDSYRHHLNMIHGNKQRIYSCADCGKTFLRKVNLKNHVNSAHLKLKPFKCDKCDKRFPNASKRKVHANTHSGLPKPRTHICDICGRGFTAGTVLKNHVRTHTGERPYACAWCDAAFAQRVAFLAHVRRVHCKPGWTPEAAAPAAATVV